MCTPRGRKVRWLNQFVLYSVVDLGSLVEPRTVFVACVWNIVEMKTIC